jgi:hypothetical protein
MPAAKKKKTQLKKETIFPKVAATSARLTLAQSLLLFAGVMVLIFFGLLLIKKYLVSLPRDNRYYLGTYNDSQDITGKKDIDFTALYITNKEIHKERGSLFAPRIGQILGKYAAGNGYHTETSRLVYFSELKDARTYGQSKNTVLEILDFYKEQKTLFVLVKEVHSDDQKMYFSLQILAKGLAPKLVWEKEITAEEAAFKGNVVLVGSKYLHVAVGQFPHPGCYGNTDFLINLETKEARSLGDVTNLAYAAENNTFSYTPMVKELAIKCYVGGGVSEAMMNEVKAATGPEEVLPAF